MWFFSYYCHTHKPDWDLEAYKELKIKESSLLRSKEKRFRFTSFEGCRLVLFVVKLGPIVRLPPDHFKTIDPSIYAWKIALLYGFHIFNCSMKDTVIVMNSHRDPLCWQSDASKGQKYSRQHSLSSFERIYVVMLFCIIQCVTMKHFKYFKIILLLCVLKTVWSNRKYFWEMVRTWWKDLNFLLLLVCFFFYFLF